MTLKRIRTDQAELGMFIHRLEGNWFRHPFWKARFVLDDPARLEALRESEVRSLLIDVVQGRDVEVRDAEGSGADRASPTPPSRAAVGGAAVAGRRAATLSPEIARAERLARATGKAVNRMFIEAQLGKHIAASDVEPVVEEIYASIQRNIYAFNGLLQCQSDQLHLYRHALAVSALMVALGRRMGLSPAMTREAGMVGLMMDVDLAQIAAEAGVADYRDLPTEQAKAHVVQGLIRLRAAGDIPQGVLNGCQQHHERIDGSGYPQGLSGAAIGTPAGRRLRRSGARSGWRARPDPGAIGRLRCPCRRAAGRSGRGLSNRIDCALAQRPVGHGGRSGSRRHRATGRPDLWRDGRWRRHDPAAPGHARAGPVLWRGCD